MATQMRVFSRTTTAGDGAPDQFSRSRPKSTPPEFEPQIGGPRRARFAAVYSYRNASAGKIRDAENDG